MSYNLLQTKTKYIHNAILQWKFNVMGCPGILKHEIVTP